MMKRTHLVWGLGAVVAGLVFSACQADRRDLVFDDDAFRAVGGAGGAPESVDGGAPQSDAGGSGVTAGAGPAPGPCEGDAVDPDADLELGTLKGSVVEGQGTATLTLSLTTRPCGEVELTLSPDGQLTVEPRRLTFGVDDWDQPQALSISAIHDFEREGDHEGELQLALASDDADYDGLEPDPIAIAIRDRAHLRLVSVAHDAETPTNGASHSPTVSDDGSLVAFVSEADNLVESDGNGESDVFLRDLSSETTTKVSSNATGGDADGASNQARLSASGGELLFYSEASNLLGGSIATSEVYLYQHESKKTTLVSLNCTGCSQTIQSLMLSGDGLVAAYGTRRQLLDDPENELDVFAYDVSDGTTTQASLSSQGLNGDTTSGSNAWVYGTSYDGRHLGISSIAYGLDTPEIQIKSAHGYLKDRETGRLVRVNRHHGGVANCEGADTFNYRVFSGPDGNTAIFDSNCVHQLAPDQAPDTNDVHDVIERQITEMTTRRLSVSSSGEQADAGSIVRGISADARYVAFSSAATNLVEGDTNGAIDLFIHDREEGTTRRVSLDENYQELPRGIGIGAISWNGKFVVFSALDSLLEGDLNDDVEDLYVVQLFED